MALKILVLGGTRDGLQLADQLSARNIALVYSVLGRVRVPTRNYPIRVGGFKRKGGLTNYLQSNEIALLMDATHPYAQNISWQAHESCESAGIPYWRLHRPEWQAQDNDQWFEFSNMDSLIEALAHKKSVFMSAGQLSEAQTQRLAEFNGQRQFLRTAIKPSHDIPKSMTLMTAIGPFTQASECELFDRHQFDVVVSKNSGGRATAAKLQVARERSVPVFFITRPSQPNADRTFVSVEECITHMDEWKRLDDK